MRPIVQLPRLVLDPSLRIDVRERGFDVENIIPSVQRDSTAPLYQLRNQAVTRTEPRTVLPDSLPITGRQIRLENPIRVQNVDSIPVNTFARRGNQQRDRVETVAKERSIPMVTVSNRQREAVMPVIGQENSNNNYNNNNNNANNMLSVNMRNIGRESSNNNNDNNNNANNMLSARMQSISQAISNNNLNNVINVRQSRINVRERQNEEVDAVVKGTGRVLRINNARMSLEGRGYFKNKQNTFGNIANTEAIGRNVLQSRASARLSQDRTISGGLNRAGSQLDRQVTMVNGNLAHAIANTQNAQSDFLQNGANAGIVPSLGVTGRLTRAGMQLNRQIYVSTMNGPEGNIANAMANRQNGRMNLLPNTAKPGIAPSTERGWAWAGAPLGEQGYISSMNGVDGNLANVLDTRQNAQIDLLQNKVNIVTLPSVAMTRGLSEERQGYSTTMDGVQGNFANALDTRQNARMDLLQNKANREILQNFVNTGEVTRYGTPLEEAQPRYLKSMQGTEAIALDSVQRARGDRIQIRSNGRIIQEMGATGPLKSVGMADQRGYFTEGVDRDLASAMKSGTNAQGDLRQTGVKLGSQQQTEFFVGENLAGNPSAEIGYFNTFQGAEGNLANAADAKGNTHRELAPNADVGMNQGQYIAGKALQTVGMSTDHTVPGVQTVIADPLRSSQFERNVQVPLSQPAYDQSGPSSDPVFRAQTDQTILTNLRSGSAESRGSVVDVTGSARMENFVDSKSISIKQQPDILNTQVEAQLDVPRSDGQVFDSRIGLMDTQLHGPLGDHVVGQLTRLINGHVQRVEQVSGSQDVLMNRQVDAQIGKLGKGEQAYDQNLGLANAQIDAQLIASQQSAQVFDPLDGLTNTGVDAHLGASNKAEQGLGPKEGLLKAQIDAQIGASQRSEFFAPVVDFNARTDIGASQNRFIMSSSNGQGHINDIQAFPQDGSQPTDRRPNADFKNAGMSASKDSLTAGFRDFHPDRVLHTGKGMLNADLKNAGLGQSKDALTAGRNEFRQDGSMVGDKRAYVSDLKNTGMGQSKDSLTVGINDFHHDRSLPKDFKNAGMGASKDSLTGVDELRQDGFLSMGNGKHSADSMNARMGPSKDAMTAELNQFRQDGSRVADRRVSVSDLKNAGMGQSKDSLTAEINDFHHHDRSLPKDLKNAGMGASKDSLTGVDGLRQDGFLSMGNGKHSADSTNARMGPSKDAMTAELYQFRQDGSLVADRRVSVSDLKNAGMGQSKDSLTAGINDFHHHDRSLPKDLKNAGMGASKDSLTGVDGLRQDGFLSMGNGKHSADSTNARMGPSKDAMTAELYQFRQDGSLVADRRVSVSDLKNAGMGQSKDSLTAGINDFHYYRSLPKDFKNAGMGASKDSLTGVDGFRQDGFLSTGNGKHSADSTNARMGPSKDAMTAELYQFRQDGSRVVERGRTVSDLKNAGMGQSKDSLTVGINDFHHERSLPKDFKNAGIGASKDSLTGVDGLRQDRFLSTGNGKRKAESTNARMGPTKDAMTAELNQFHQDGSLVVERGRTVSDLKNAGMGQSKDSMTAPLNEIRQDGGLPIQRIANVDFQNAAMGTRQDSFTGGFDQSLQNGGLPIEKMPNAHLKNEGLGSSKDSLTAGFYERRQEGSTVAGHERPNSDLKNVRIGQSKDALTAGMNVFPVDASLPIIYINTAAGNGAFKDSLTGGSNRIHQDGGLPIEKTTNAEVKNSGLAPSKDSLTAGFSKYDLDGITSAGQGKPNSDLKNAGRVQSKDALTA